MGGRAQDRPIRTFGAAHRRPSRVSTIERQIVRPTAVVRLFGLTTLSASGKRDSPAQTQMA
jgi:hypothetical protein